MTSPVNLLDFGGRRRTPMFRQTEASECGLACLAMVAAHHGFEGDMPTYRRHFGIGLRGATLKTLMQIADRIGLNGRAVKVEMSALRDLRLPAVLHWNLNHFVVLTRMAGSLRGIRYTINDPANGVRSMGEAEFSRGFTGVAVEFVKRAGFQPQRARSPLRVSQLWSSIHGASGALLGVLALSAMLQLVGLAMPFYLQLGLDNVLPTSDEQLLKVLALGFGGLTVISTLTGWLRSIALLNMASAFSFQIIDNLYRHLLALPLSWFQKRHVGDVVSRFGSTQPITDFISQGAISALIDGVMTLITLLLMFVYSPMLSGLALAAWAAYALLRVASFHTMRQLNVNAIAANARENTSFIETMRGMPTIKSSGQEANRRRIWQSLKAAAVNAQLRSGRYSVAFDSASSLVLGVERIIFVYVAVRTAMRGDLTVGMIFAFQAYKQQFLDASTRIVDQVLKYRLIDVHLGRISDIALSRPEPLGPPDPNDRGCRGEIELRDVSFRYGTSEPEVLRGISLRVQPGEMVALVGPSGGGKSTLLKLMMGVLEPTSGQILVDGRPLIQYGVRNWRSRIGSVLQEDQLFAGTLAENIAFFDPEIDMDKVRDACRKASIWEEIQSMPLGLESLVGDMGSSLSGGQRQRVMLARALYRDPAVLFMDEGTANLDPASEARIVDMLRGMDIPRVVSAHRPLAVQAATTVVLVQNGGASPISVHAGSPGRASGGTA